MSEEIAPPIIIAEDLRGKFWLTVYRSPEAVTRQLEPWYSTDEDYRAFDSVGRVLELGLEKGVEARRFLFFKFTPEDLVVVRLRSSEARPGELRELLLRFLEQEGQTAGVDQQTPTGELIERCAADGNSYGP